MVNKTYIKLNNIQYQWIGRSKKKKNRKWERQKGHCVYGTGGKVAEILTSTTPNEYEGLGLLGSRVYYMGWL